MSDARRRSDRRTAPWLAAQVARSDAAFGGAESLATSLRAVPEVCHGQTTFVQRDFHGQKNHASTTSKRQSSQLSSFERTPEKTKRDRCVTLKQKGERHISLFGLAMADPGDEFSIIRAQKRMDLLCDPMAFILQAECRLVFLRVAFFADPKAQTYMDMDRAISQSWQCRNSGKALRAGQYLRPYCEDTHTTLVWCIQDPLLFEALQGKLGSTRWTFGPCKANPTEGGFNCSSNMLQQVGFELIWTSLGHSHYRGLLQQKLIFVGYTKYGTESVLYIFGVPQMWSSVGLIPHNVWLVRGSLSGFDMGSSHEMKPAHLRYLAFDRFEHTSQVVCASPAVVGFFARNGKLWLEACRSNRCFLFLADPLVSLGIHVRFAMLFGSIRGCEGGMKSSHKLQVAAAEEIRPRFNFLLWLASMSY